MNELVSVIIPVYNVESFLECCVDSVLNQTYKTLQIILVDDGSTDSSSQLCNEYQKRDLRVEVIHKKNGGLSDARNVGIKAARGRYLTFIDSDDFIFPDMIEKLYIASCGYQAEFVQCQSICCSVDDSINSVQYKKVISRAEVYENKGKMNAYLITNRIDTVAWKKLYDIKLFNKIEFPKDKWHEDAFTIIQLIESSNKVVILNDVGYVYRIEYN